MGALMTGDFEETTTEQASLKFEEARSLFEKGLIGTIEFRNWLARKYPDFATIRDNDVDEDIINMAKLRQRRIEAEATLGVQSE